MNKENVFCICLFYFCRGFRILDEDIREISLCFSLLCVMIFWRIKEDFGLLFTSSSSHLKPIDGLRSIACLMLITVHVFLMLDAFIPPYPNEEWLDYVRSFPFSLVGLFTYSLEIFFVISGFLLTKKFLEVLENIKNRNEFLTQYVTYLIKRVCRYWPGILLVWLMKIFLDEPTENFTSTWLFFQNYVDMELWSIRTYALWSISLDMQIHIVLPILIYFMYTYKRLFSIEYFLYILLVTSVFYSLCIFNPNTMNVLSLASRYNSLALMMPEKVEHWIQTRYNVTFSFRPLHPSPLKPFMQQLYLPLPARYGSFIIGSLLIIKMRNIQRTGHSSIDKIKKYIYFGFIWLYLFMFLIPRDDISVDNVTMTIAISIGRQLFAITQAFLLFTTLCPISHPFHSSLMKNILSLRIWTPIAKLSYLIYVLHYRIAFEVIMNTPWFSLNGYSIGFLAIFYLMIVFSLCSLIACLWHILIERPFERFITGILQWKKHST